jgi:hypothetical protein
VDIKVFAAAKRYPFPKYPTYIEKQEEGIPTKLKLSAYDLTNNCTKKVADEVTNSSDAVVKPNNLF